MIRSISTVLSGSRGPVVALGAAIIWLTFTDKKRAMVLIPILTIGVFFLPTDNMAIERVLGIFKYLDLSALARLEIQESALNDFLQNPLVGKHFMDASFGEGSWPHNFFLEAAMSMGIVGLTLSVVIVFASFRAALAGVNRKHLLLVTLLVQALVAAQFSGSLFGGSMLFALFAAVLALGIIYRRERLLLNRRSTPSKLNYQDI
ncbi:MAG TPA: hypothetical protein DD979_18715 [Gammaproteobacteria bacterium]|nr:hypothetical protein [Gammaproteobacteria bacterium]